jgi:hypothetical protein
MEKQQLIQSTHILENRVIRLRAELEQAERELAASYEQLQSVWSEEKLRAREVQERLDQKWSSIRNCEEECAWLESISVETGWQKQQRGEHTYSE